MTNYAGYVAAASGGNLVFMLDVANATIMGIAGGDSRLGPNSWMTAAPRPAGGRPASQLRRRMD